MDLITISSHLMTVTADARGAMLHSIRKDGVEYLWQADPKYWDMKDLNLFPYVARLNGGKYLFRGQVYSMAIHGFCVGADFEVTERSDSSVRLTLRDSQQTRKVYPFPFCFHVTYTLEENRLVKTCQVVNTGREELIFGLGSHPGFQVPLDGDGGFADWYLEFPERSTPTRVGFTMPDCLLSGLDQPYPLEDGLRLPLSHGLFDQDAIVLKELPRSVTLKSDRSGRSVRVDYPDMPILGLWHMPKTDAPYVCIEPWLSLPSHHDYVEDLEKQADLIHLPAGEVYTNTITITVT